MSDALTFWVLSLALILGSIVIIALVWRSIVPTQVDDPSGMVGQQGIAEENFSQAGMVFARGELWKATSDGGIIQKGDTVEVLEVQTGLVLVVRRVKTVEN